MVAPTNGNNQRVTNAVLKRDIEHLISRVEEWHQESCDRLDAVEGQTRTNTTELARLDERQKTTTGMLSVLSVIGSTIAGAVGALAK